MRASVTAGAVALLLSLGLNVYFVMRPATSPDEVEGPARGALPRTAGGAPVRAQLSEPSPSEGAHAAALSEAATEERPEPAVASADPPRTVEAAGTLSARHTIEILLEEVVDVIARHPADVDSLPQTNSLAFLAEVLGSEERIGLLLIQVADLLHTEKGPKRWAVIELLAKLQDRPGVPAEASLHATLSVLSALQQTQNGHEQIALLRALKPNQDPAALARTREALQGLLRSRTPWVRSAVIERLGEFEGPEASGALAQVATDEQESVANRVSALRRLDLEQPGEINLLLRLASDPDSELRAAAFACMGRLEPETALPVLHQALLGEPSRYARKQILGALRGFSSVKSVSVLTTYLEHAAREPEDRKHAERVLRTIRETLAETR